VSVLPVGFLHTRSSQPLFDNKLNRPSSSSTSLQNVFLTLTALLQSLFFFSLVQTSKRQPWTHPDLPERLGEGFPGPFNASVCIGFSPFLSTLWPANVSHWRCCISLPVTGKKPHVTTGGL